MDATEYCSYELSKALKACGFDEPCSYYYTTDDACPDCVWLTTWALCPRDYNNFKERHQPKSLCSAPTLWQAQKWLREKHHISIRVSYIGYHKVWFADWLNLDSGEFDDTDATFATYEEALADGITVALKLTKSR